MRKYRIVTTAVMMTACATAELHSQMSMFFKRASEPVVYQDSSAQPNSSCTMPFCRTDRPYGHFVTSWRRWPEDISAYTTNPQLTPFVIPDRSGAPDTEVPDALDEAEFSPKNRKDAEGVTTPETPPSTAPDTDDGMPQDLPSAEPLDNSLPDDPTDFPAIDIDDSGPGSESDVFGSPETDIAPSLDDPSGVLPGTDDGGFGDELDDGFGSGFDDAEDFGSREPRRFHRNARSSEPAFDPRAEREATLSLNGPDSVRAVGAEVISTGEDVSSNGNPLRRKQISQRPESVAHTLHYGDRSILANRRETRRWDDDRFDQDSRPYQDHRDARRDRRSDYDPREMRSYDARQIEYRDESYEDRYPRRRGRYDDRRGYEDERFERRDGYNAPMQRATDLPSKSSNPLRP